MAVLRRATLAALVALPACALVTGLDGDFEEVACLRDCADGAVDAPVAPGPTDANEAPLDAGDAGPTVTVALVDLDPILDFDLADEALLALRPSTRIDTCTDACKVLVPQSRMPPESATRKNASLAVVAAHGDVVLVAQSGDVPCGGTTAQCADNADLPGLWIVGSSVPVRKYPTIPTGIAKSSRMSDGWLVGRLDTWAFAQLYSNESPPVVTTSVTAWPRQYTQPSEPVVYGRSRGGTIPQTQPLVFVAMPFASTMRGFVGADGDLLDLADRGKKIGVEPIRAAATTTDAPASDVFLQGRDTGDGSILAFHNDATRTVGTHRFPGLPRDGGHELVATARWVGVVDPGAPDAGKELALRVCRVSAVLADTCEPLVVPLQLESVVRVRTRDDDAYFLGRGLDGATRIVRVRL